MIGWMIWVHGRSVPKNRAMMGYAKRLRSSEDESVSHGRLFGLRSLEWWFPNGTSVQCKRGDRVVAERKFLSVAAERLEYVASEEP